MTLSKTMWQPIASFCNRSFRHLPIYIYIHLKVDLTSRARLLGVEVGRLQRDAGGDGRHHAQRFRGGLLAQSALSHNMHRWYLNMYYTAS